MTYIDAFVLPVPKDKIEDYKRIVKQSAPLWQEYGATAYFEAIGDDVPYGKLTSFPRSVQAKDDEVIFLSILLYPSRETRDKATKTMMEDPRMKDFMENMPTDGDRMIFGGFDMIYEQ